MNRHREQWHARKMQSEGKLRSLKKKVDTLDELVGARWLQSVIALKEVKHLADSGSLQRLKLKYNF